MLFGTLAVAVLLYLVMHQTDVWMRQILDTFIREHGGEIDDYGNAGQYYNLAYGLPLALIGAVLGAAATFIAGVIANRQGDVQILEFVELKTKPSILIYKRLTAAVGEVLRCGNEARELGQALLEQVKAEGGPEQSRLWSLLKESAEAFQDLETAKGFVETIDDPAHRGMLAAAYLFLVNLQAQASTVSQLFDLATDDLYASLFAREQLSLTPQALRPLAWLRSKIPASAPISDLALGETMHELAMNLRHFADITGATELPVTTLSLPTGNYTIDYLGYVLRPFWLTQREIPMRDGPRIGRYRFNLGAAYLLAVAQYLPERKTIVSVFSRIFPNRAKVALKFLQTALPDRRQFGAPFVLDSLTPNISDFNRLIIVDVFDGEDFVPEFYDPARHGPIPTSGYVEFPDPPFRQAV